MADPANPKPPLESSPWQSSAGLAAHPDSPVGGGGPGRFVTPMSHGMPGNDSAIVAHPDSPQMRYENLEAEGIQALRREGGLEVEDAVPLDSGVKEQPPPVTVPEKIDISRQNDKEDITYKLEILADKNDDPSLPDRAARTFLIDGLSVEYPQFTTNSPADAKPEKTIITGLVGKVKVTGSVTIQSRYAVLSGPNNYAGWGRGTVPTDKAAGNVKAGFHESCHRADYKAFIKSKIYPTLNFTVAKGKTAVDWEKECARCDAEKAAFFKQAESESEKQTDEVGDTMSSKGGKHG